MRRFASAPFALCLAAILFSVVSMSGCSETPESNLKRIVILTNGPDPFWDTCEAGAKSAEEKLGLKGKGYRVTFERADFTDKGQINKLKQYLLQDDIVAVGISVYNPESRAVAAEMRKLRKKGVKVITIDGDTSRDKFRDARYAYLGTDNIIGGRELGRSAKALAPSGANFAFFVGSTSAANAIARMDGFKQGAGSGFKEIERLEDGGDRPKARENVKGALNRAAEKKVDINMLVGIWAYNTPQIVAEVKARDIRKKTKVVCFDAAEASIREMGNGNVDIMVVQNPYQMGYDGVKLMLALVEDDKKTIKEMYPDYKQEGDGDIFRTELRVVVPDDKSPIKKKDLSDKKTIFMTLPEFKKWLADRKLVSS